MKSQSKPRKPGQLAFRRPLKSIESANPESRKIYVDIRSRTGAVPEIYRVKALADNPDWLRVLHNSVFQWPRSCVLDEKTKELVGLAKSIAYAWEPGVLTNIEGAITAGATPDEITEAILIASTIIGLADLDYACRAGHFETYDDRAQTPSDPSVQRVYDDATSTFGKIPELYRFSLLAGNPDWLKAVHEPAKIRYANGVLGQKTKALICLGASAAKRWDKGVQEHLEFALKSGAQPREIADVLCSIYKTAVSIGVQTGFSVPCSIPEMNGFKLLKDYYSKPNSSGRLRRKKAAGAGRSVGR